MGLGNSKKIGAVIWILVSFLEIAPEVVQGVKTGKTHISGTTARTDFYDHSNCRQEAP